MGIRAKVVRSALLAVAVASGRSEAASLTVSAADQLCTPLAISCTIGDDVTVIDGSTLDFGIRRVDLIDKGRLHSGSGGMNIRCGSFHAYGSTDAAAISAKASDAGFSQGGFVHIEATKGCSDAEAHCENDGNCQLGICGVRRCANRNGRLCDADADCELGTCLANRRCSGATTNRCLSNADCSFGPCSTQATCPRLAAGPEWPDGAVPCDEDADCDLGVCDRGSGAIDLDATVNVAGDVPGVLFLEAEGPVTLHRTVEADAGPDEAGGSLAMISRGSDVRLLGGLHATGISGGDFEAEAFGDIEISGEVDVRGGQDGGGVIDVEAGGSIVVTGRLMASSMTSGGNGGWLDLFAGEDVVMDASGLPSAATQVMLHGADGPEWAEGSGGQFFAEAERDVVVVGPSRISLRGALPEGLGGAVEFLAGRDVHVHTIVEASTPATNSGGGSMGLLAGRNLTLLAGSKADLSGGSQGSGGSFYAQAGEEAVIDGAIDVRGGFPDSFDNLDVAACAVRVGPNADVEVRSPGGGSTFSGAESLVVEAGAKVFSKTGENELRYRSAAHPPIVSGSLTPAAKLILDPNLPTCGCGDGLPDEGEECDGGPSPYTMGRACRDDCTRIACGHPTDSKGPLPATADVLFTLRASLSGSPCDLRVCDADGSGHVSVRDVLRLLRASVGVATSLDCPA